MHRKHALTAVRSETVFQLTKHRERIRPAFQWNREDAGGLVDDDQFIVLVDDVDSGDHAGAGKAPRAARTVEPRPHHITSNQPTARIAETGFIVVEVDLPSLQRLEGAAP